MLRRLFGPALLLTLLAAGLGATVLLTGTRSGRSLVGRSLGRPLLEAPAVVELGPLESGTIADFRFRLANRGGASLELDQFRTDCACNGLDREDGDGFARLDQDSQVHLAPGESVGLRFRTAVRGRPGEPLQSVVYVRTNDPDRPEVAVQVRVRAVLSGVAATPRHWVAGTVRQSETAGRVFDLSDSAHPPRTVERVECSDPGRFAIDLRPTSAGAAPEGSTRIGQLEVRVLTDRPGPFDATLKLHVAGGKADPDPIRITGRVVAPVECSPGTVLLPRMSSGGPLYEATCLVRSTDGHPLSLAPDATPDGLAVEVATADGEPPSQTVTIRVTAAGRRERSEVVRLTATVAGKTIPVEIAVRVAPPEDGR